MCVTCTSAVLLFFFSQLHTTQVLCWGVRDMKKYQLLAVNSPLVELECGGHVQCTEAIKNAKENPNFPKPVVSMDVVGWLVFLIFDVGHNRFPHIY